MARSGGEGREAMDATQRHKNRERLAELQVGAPARQARMARAMRAAVEAVRSAHPPTAAHMTVQRSRRSP